MGPGGNVGAGRSAWQPAAGRAAGVHDGQFASPARWAAHRRGMDGVRRGCGDGDGLSRMTLAARLAAAQRDPELVAAAAAMASDRLDVAERGLKGVLRARPTEVAA